MSKQSNAFQKLIHHIHNKIENNSARVTESAPLLEKNINEPVKREIDVLIEKEVNGTVGKIAVECRDRAAKDDIQWIDCLIGKYQNLDVHKVIAVSNSGFSKNAFLKAKANGIDLKTIEDAFQIDFGDEFHKLGLLYISHTFKLKKFTMHFNPPLNKKPSLKTLVYHNELEIGDLEGLANFCFEEGPKKNIIPYFKRNMLNIFKTKADTERHVLIEKTIPIRKLYIEDDGIKHFINSIKFTLVGIPTTQDIQVNHGTYEGALITEGLFDIEEMKEIHTAWIAQLPKDKEARVFVKSKPRKTKK
jgi:hypothetical protein